LLVLFSISIAVPFIYSGIVYSNYWTMFDDLAVWATSFFILISCTILLTLLDKNIKKRYTYAAVAFSSIGLFIIAFPLLRRFSDYLFIQRNEEKLKRVIEQMKTEKISRVYADDSSDEFKIIKRTLTELQINDAQVTEDGSILFMEGGFMEADGWCYSETGSKPKKYYVNVWIGDGENYENISYWDHSHGNWYRWAAR